jgi:adenine-specific DNA-methyltransferase
MLDTETKRWIDTARDILVGKVPDPKSQVEQITIALIYKFMDGMDAGKLNLYGGTRPDRGFRVFRLAESNFTTWDAEQSKDADELAGQLFRHVDHIREGRSPDDLLHEILLKSGFPLTTPVETLDLAGKRVHSVSGGALLLCLDRDLTLELIRAMAERKPERVVCLDEGFAGNDPLKTNAVKIFKSKGVILKTV